MMTPPRPTLALPFLLAGAIINVAVAWWIAAKAPPAYPWNVDDPDPPAWFVAPRWPGEGAWRHCRRENTRIFGFGHAVYRIDSGYADRPDAKIHAETVAFGWPMRSMRCGWVLQGGARRTFGDRIRGPRSRLPPPATPLFRASGGKLPHAVWIPGFLANTLFYSAILALPLTLLPLRARRRRRRGRCPKCNYDLAGLERCPECGTAR